MVICALFLSCLAAIGLYVGHICLPVTGYGKLLWFPEGPHMAWQTLPVVGLGFRLFFSIKKSRGATPTRDKLQRLRSWYRWGSLVIF